MTISEDTPGRARLIDQRRFGPWALVTGASAGIGKEFAHQLAAHGLNLVAPMKPLGVRQCVTEALTALEANRARIVPGHLVRTPFGLVPASMTRGQTAKMFEVASRSKPSV